MESSGTKEPSVNWGPDPLWEDAFFLGGGTSPDPFKLCEIYGMWSIFSTILDRRGSSDVAVSIAETCFILRTDFLQLSCRRYLVGCLCHNSILLNVIVIDFGVWKIL